MSRAINIIKRSNRHKRSNVYASTPNSMTANRSHISLSTIETGSSSSNNKTNLQFQNSNKRKSKYKKEGKKEDIKSKIKDSDSELENIIRKHKKQVKFRKEQQKNSSKKKFKTVQKKQISKDTDSEWETESEKSVTESSVDSLVSTTNFDKYIKLFEDPPEKIREASNIDEIVSLRESPIIGSSRKRFSSVSKNNDIVFLHTNLLSSDILNVEEIDKDETIFENHTKTQVQKPKTSKQTSKSFNSPTLFSATDIFRHQSNKIYSRNRVQSSPLKSPMKLMDFKQKLPPILKKKEDIPPGMICEYGYYDKTVKKWITHTKYSSKSVSKNNKRKRKIRNKIIKHIEITQKQKHDVYDRYNEIDTLKTGPNNKRMSFCDFRRKQKLIQKNQIIDSITISLEEN